MATNLPPDVASFPAGDGTTKYYAHSEGLSFRAHATLAEAAADAALHRSGQPVPYTPCAVLPAGYSEQLQARLAPVAASQAGKAIPGHVWVDACERCGGAEEDAFDDACGYCGNGIFKAMPQSEASLLEAAFEVWCEEENIRRSK